MNTTKKGTLHTEINNNIATVTFYHPQSNSLPSELLTRLTDQINTLSQNNQIVAILLKSAGNKVFCAGASFDELLSIKNSQDGKKFFSGFANLINAMRKCSKIIVGRIHGKAVGGGVGIIASCDYAFATTQAFIKLSELAIGIGPFVIEPAVSRKIGKNATIEMTLEPDIWKDVSWAKNKGLYAEIYQNTTILDQQIDLFCSKLASYNPEALYKIKKIIWEGTENWDTLLYQRAAVSGSLVLSDFTKNTLSKFGKP